MANLITLLRLVLVFVALAFVNYGGQAGHVWALVITVITISLDGIDGVVARLRHETSEFGGVFDIVVDRIVENAFWIFFAAKHVIPVWIPLVIISRGFFTDGIRSVAFSKGMTAFGDKTMQKSAISRAIVSSRFSRGLYGFVKVMSFLFLIIIDAISLPSSSQYFSQAASAYLSMAGYVTIYVTVIFCIVRGLPVMIDSRELLFPRSND